MPIQTNAKDYTAKAFNNGASSLAFFGLCSELTYSVADCISKFAFFQPWWKMSQRLGKIRKRHRQLWRLKQVLPVVYQFYQESPVKQMLEAIPLASTVPWFCGWSWLICEVLYLPCSLSPRPKARKTNGLEPPTTWISHQRHGFDWIWHPSFIHIKNY